MNRQECVDKITTCAARFVAEVKGFNAAGHYSVNIHAENFLIPVLNSVFNLKLENVNYTERKNYPAIDLVDLSNRVAFQITSTPDLTKIKSTLETFFEKKLDGAIDTLYIYILTEKQQSYSDAKVKKIVPTGFVFDIDSHVIDINDLLVRINGISSTPALMQLTKLFQQEFSDIQIEQRQKKYKNGALNNEPEDLYTNFLEISFPAQLYKADLNIDEEAITKRMNDYRASKGWRQVTKFKLRKMIVNELRQKEILLSDWILHENSLYTFRDLNSSTEPLLNIIDRGTITSIDCKSFYETNDDTLRVFKHLLRNTLMEFCKTKGMEWFGDGEVFRFANNRLVPNKKQVRWKGKKESTKTVIFEMINKEKKHIICFRSLAFHGEFDVFDNKWFLTINPTWSFTNPGGYKTSRFEAAYMSGIKRLESNGSVCNYYRFFSFYLASSDLFSTDYPYFRTKPTKTLSLFPRLEEKSWKPIKLAEENSGAPPSDMEHDNELNPTLFD